MTISKLKLNYPWLDNGFNQEVKCCLCENQTAPISVFSFQLNGKDYYIRKCPSDSLMYLYPQPSGQYSDTLYRHPSYFSGKDDMYGLFVEEEKSSQIAKIRLQEIISYTPKAQSLLEIGSAYGHLLSEAKNQNWEKVSGVEFSDSAVKVCRTKGLEVVKNLSELKGNEYDVVALYSVLEHMSNPFNFLVELKSFCRPQTLVFIRVPKMSETGPWLSLLDHFWHFNESTLECLLTRCGYQQKWSFPSGIFKGIKHQGTLESFTVVCQLKP